jgi:hypothetical protein
VIELVFWTCSSPTCGIVFAPTTETTPFALPGSTTTAKQPPLSGKPYTRDGVPLML